MRPNSLTASSTRTAQGTFSKPLMLSMRSLPYGQRARTTGEKLRLTALTPGENKPGLSPQLEILCSSNDGRVCEQARFVAQLTQPRYAERLRRIFALEKDGKYAEALAGYDALGRTGRKRPDGALLAQYAAYAPCEGRGSRACALGRHGAHRSLNRPPGRL